MPARMKENTEHLLPSPSNNNNSETYDNEMHEVNLNSSVKFERNSNAEKKFSHTDQFPVQLKSTALEHGLKFDSYKDAVQNSKKNDLLPTLHSTKLTNVARHNSTILPLRASKEQNIIQDTENQSVLRSLPSLKPNSSIYKLAFDESLTDQSEIDDANCPSSMFDWNDDTDFDRPNPESQIPTSITSAEILIHEADSTSDAGSEDVELIPHRYESESFLNDSKHMYVNKLSLAVELLRTRETLPYDDEFKRVEGEDNSKLAKTYPGVITDGKSGFVNKIFFNESHRLESEHPQHESQNISTTITTKPKEIDVMKPKHQNAAINVIESGIHSLEESCESAKEACEVQCTERHREHWTDSDEVRASYLRLGVHAQHRFNIFTPRTSVVNPCFCCVVM